jgi:O-methyltransferase
MKNAREMYLDLLKKTLTFTLWEGKAAALDFPKPKSSAKRLLLRLLQDWLSKKNLAVAYSPPFDSMKREVGLDWPALGETMIGIKRLDNIQFCIETIIKDGIPGDLIETGVWRGGAVIFMKACLDAFGDENRTVWVADSFEGLPAPDETKYPSDASSRFHTYAALKVTLENVKENFKRYGLLDNQVRFLKGWFKDTLPTAPITNLAIVRLDGDMYESTMDGLTNLYPKLTIGGFLIVDDYGIESCKKAVNDYRERNNISSDVMKIDGSSIFWRKK